MKHDQASAGQGLEHEVPVRNRVHAVGEHAGKSQVLGHGRGVQGIGGPGQGRGAERGDPDALLGVGQALHIALEHPGVGQEVLGQGHGLGGLEMGAPGQERVLVLRGALQEHGGQLGQAGAPGRGPARDEQPEVQGHLVVARAAGVELAAHRSHQGREAAFNVHVHVFQGRVPGERAGLDLGEHGVQTLDERGGLVPGDDPLGGQHAGVGLGPGDVLGVQPVVETHRLGVALHQGVGGRGEAAAPHLFPAHASSSLA